MTDAPLRVTAGPIVAGGDALVRREGEKVMFVDGALPGEVVDVEITNERSQMINARVVDVIEVSPDRVEPTCALFHDNCGGCQWNYISIDIQRQLKVDIVRDALARIAKMSDVDLAFEAGVSPTGYRTTMRMATKNARPGMRRRGTHEVLPPIPCTITHPLLQSLITEGEYEVDEVTLRASVTTGETQYVMDKWDNSSLNETINGQDFRISANAFFQSGPEAAELITSVVDRYVPIDAKWIIDAYAGIGVIGGVLAAKRGSKITAIESNQTAVSDAHYNLAQYDADIIEAQVSDIELFEDDNPDVIVADPSRSGLGKSAAKALIELEAPMLVLVSCDPASMARDTTLLREAGYKLGQVRVLDLFPQTPHVETVSVFTR